MPTANIGDAEIYYEAEGEGPPLLLVPGLGGIGSFWAPQVAGFSDRFRCIIHDHRGCGRSTRTPGEYTVEGMADDTLRLMDAFGIEKAHLVGHSTGGAIGQVIALDHPDRLASLVLSATWAGSDPFFRRCFEVRKEALERLGLASYLRVSNAFLWPPAWIRDHDGDLSRAEAATLASPPDLAIALARIDAIVAFNRRGQLGAITTPTMVICARDDMVVPLHLSEEIAAAIPRARLVRLDGGGHFVTAADPAAYNAPVRSFLLSQG